MMRGRERMRERGGIEAVLVAVVVVLVFVNRPFDVAFHKFAS